MNKIAFLEGYLSKEAAANKVVDYLGAMARGDRKLAKGWGLTNDMLHEVNGKGGRTKAVQKIINDYMTGAGYDAAIHKGLDLKGLGNKNLKGVDYIMDYLKKVDPMLASTKKTADAAIESATPSALATYGIPSAAGVAGLGAGYGLANA